MIALGEVVAYLKQTSFLSYATRSMIVIYSLKGLSKKKKSKKLSDPLKKMLCLYGINGHSFASSKPSYSTQRTKKK